MYVFETARLATTLPSLCRDKFKLRCIIYIVVQVWTRACAEYVAWYFFLEEKQSAWSEYSLCATLDLFVDVGSSPSKRYKQAYKRVSLPFLFSSIFVCVRYYCVPGICVVSCVYVVFCFVLQLFGAFSVSSCATPPGTSRRGTLYFVYNCNIT